MLNWFSSRKDVEEQEQFDNILRPKTFSDYVGQEDLKEKLSIAIQAAKERNETLPSILIGGPSGYGKTTIAQIIANEYGTECKTFICSAIKSKADIMEIVTKARENSVVVYDEMHSLTAPLQECMYSVLEDWAITIKVGTKVVGSVKVTPHCIVGCTTSTGKLTEPFRNRFGIIHNLRDYTDDELALLIKANASKIGCNFDDDDLFLDLARRCRGVPRTINRLLHRVRDYAQVKNNGMVDQNTLDEAMKLEGIDRNGLTELDYKYVYSMYKNFGCQPVGVNSLASSLNESKETLENTIEPMLMKQGLIIKTKTGRTLTQEGIDLALKYQETVTN